MPALMVVLWVLWFVIAVRLNFEFVGMRSMVQFFPEGWRWWMLPVQLLTLFNFAMCILFNPFSS